MPYTPLTIPYVTGMSQGWGVDLIKGEPTTLVFSDLPLTDSPQPDFSSTEQSIQTAADYSSVISATADIEGQAWTEDGEVGVNSSTHFVREQQYNAQALGFFIWKAVTTSQRMASNTTLNNLQLSAEMVDRITSDPTDFLASYGTHFIAGFMYGGSFAGSILIQATSESDRQALVTSFGVSMNAWGTGKGKIDASFAQHVHQACQTHEHRIRCNGQGVDPPKFTAETVASMQDYLDDQFVTDLGTGVQLSAVCYPWEALPAVMNLPGYVPGTLAPPVDQGVLATLLDQSRRLEYAIETATYMQTSNIFVSQPSSQALQADLDALLEAQGKIQDLTPQALEQLDAQSVTSYVVADEYLPDLTDIASGRATIGWSLALDGAFTPNTQADPDGYTQGTVVAYPSGQYISVLAADHTDGVSVSDGTLDLGFVYQPAPVAVGEQPPAGLQNQVQLAAQLSWDHSPTTGPWIAPSTGGEPSRTHWKDYEYDTVAAWFA